MDDDWGYHHFFWKPPYSSIFHHHPTPEIAAGVPVAGNLGVDMDGFTVGADPMGRMGPWL